MIRPTRSSASSFCVSSLILPSSIETSIFEHIVYFLLFILFLVYFFRVVTWEKKKLKQLLTETMYFA